MLLVRYLSSCGILKTIYDGTKQPNIPNTGPDKGTSLYTLVHQKLLKAMLVEKL